MFEIKSEWAKVVRNACKILTTHNHHTHHRMLFVLQYLLKSIKIAHKHAFLCTSVVHILACTVLFSYFISALSLNFFFKSFSFLRRSRKKENTQEKLCADNYSTQNIQHLKRSFYFCSWDYCSRSGEGSGRNIRGRVASKHKILQKKKNKREEIKGNKV